MRFLHRVSGLSLTDRVRSSAILEKLRVEPDVKSVLTAANVLPAEKRYHRNIYLNLR